jgi:beta-lactamase superfamily II metal-dependent hydrolase
MKFTVHNVGHGFCGEIRASNGNMVLIDCGSSDTFRPSEQLADPVSLLIVSNYDQDHISDLRGVRSRLGVDFVLRNWSVRAADLRALKKEQCGFVSEEMESMLQMMGEYQPRVERVPSGALVDPYQPAVVHPGVKIASYYNDYSAFPTSTNNLSVVTFVEMMGLKFVFGGDMETAGWKALLGNPRFRLELYGVTVYIASHHGRESGYCEDVFDCATNVKAVVISDCEEKFDTQDMNSTYERHASGMYFGNQFLKVVSTRDDGSIWWWEEDAAQAA